MDTPSRLDLSAATRHLALDYRAPRWLPDGHSQTVWPVFAMEPLPDYRRERWNTPDDDFIDVDWIDGPLTAPCMVLFHGLEGSSHSHYARSLMRGVAALGWRGAVAHFRGCSGEPNRLPRSYHSGDTDEIDWILRRVAATGSAPLFACGVSLGGNALLKWLGERGDGAAFVRAAVSICAPLDLAAANEALTRGFSRIYAWHFLRTLVPTALARDRRFPGLVDAKRIVRARSLRDFDDAVTAPLHGFRDADDYYARSSAKGWMGGVRVPTLVIHSANDPFLPVSALPGRAQVAAAVRIEVPAEGGHVGFYSTAAQGGPWLPRRLARWVGEFL
jgi:predicted alpha/beta-fold hydrolase